MKAYLFNRLIVHNMVLVFYEAVLLLNKVEAKVHL